VIDVAGQAGHSPETCLRYHAHLFAEFDPGVRVSAEELIRKARLDAGGRSEDEPDDAGKPPKPRFAAQSRSRRPDSNRGPLHYE
jgi:hypothetical protein